MTTVRIDINGIKTAFDNFNDLWNDSSKNVALPHDIQEKNKLFRKPILAIKFSYKCIMYAVSCPVRSSSVAMHINV